MHIRHLAMAIAAAALIAGPARAAESDDILLGQQLVTTLCANCHAVEATGDSPLPAAPRFRDLHLRYDIEALAEPLVEGIITGHPVMPHFAFTPEQAAGIIAYIKSLSPKVALR